MARRTLGRHGSGVPLALLIPAVLAVAFLITPMVALLVRVPWDDFLSQLRSSEVRTTLRLSLQCAAMATVLSVLFGVPLAWVLARLRFPGRSVLRALVTVPLVLPPVVGGVALLYALGRNGLVGGWLDDTFGLTFPFTTSGVVLAETFVAMPFLVVSVEGAIRSLDERYEEAAATLGASRWFAVRHVTLPRLGPAISAGAVLCFARALGEFGATITFAGNFPGTTQTMPLAVYVALQNEPGTALVLSVLMLGISVVLLASLRDRWLPGSGRAEVAP